MNARLTQSIAAALLLRALVLAGHSEGVITNCTEQELRSALQGGGLVTFASDCSITLSQTLTITAPDTTIDADGFNVVISGGGKVRVMNAAANLTLRGITLANGNSTNSGGGALLVNPGVTVVADDCLFVSNNVVGLKGTSGLAGSDEVTQGGDGQDGSGGTAGLGGAIWNRGILTLMSCIVSNNSVTGGTGGNGGAGGAGTGTLGQGGTGGGGGAGGSAYGGGIHNAGNLTLTRCTIAGNTATAANGGSAGAGGDGNYPGRAGQGGAGGIAYGGGVYNALNLSVENTTMSGNVTRGGNSTAAGTSSSGQGNQGIKGGDAKGGGLCNAWWSSLINSTFYGNTATGGAGGTGGAGTSTLEIGGQGGNGGDGVGGGIENSGTLSLLNCTAASCGAFGGTNGVAGSGRNAGGDGATGRPLGGNIASVGGSCKLANSLIIWEKFGACGYGSFVDAGYNMTSDQSISLGGRSFPNTTNPRGGSFGNHGGPTATLSLLTNSPAVDKIPTGAPDTDQRGVARENLADIGAYEVGALNAAPSILIQPEDQSVSQGSPATFSVSATGASPLNYQWLYNSAPIAGATGSTYRVASAQTTNLGPYQVVVTNLYGSVTSSQAFIRLGGTNITYVISGTIREGTNGVPGVRVNVGTGAVAITAGDGTYRTNVATGTYLITPNLTNYTFSPTNRTVVIPPAANSIDFSALPVMRISSVTNNSIVISSGGLPGVTYSVQSSTNNLVSWQPFTNVVAPVQVVIPVATNGPPSFFRMTR